MHICYIDDSGDEETRVFSVLSIPMVSWNEYFQTVKSFRHELRKKEGIYVSVELHATDFVGGRGRISKTTIPKGARCRIFGETLAFISSLSEARLFNAAGAKREETKIFERLLNRINRTMKAWDSNALLVSDEGKDYTSLVRRMRVFNPISSKYGEWEDGSMTKNIPLDRIIEDLFFRKSHRSYFIQLADFCAYALLRSEKPLPSRSKYGLDKSFDLLSHICTPECFRKDPRKFGIVRGL
jgi:Protein of unknown function (DUF3800)